MQKQDYSKILEKQNTKNKRETKHEKTESSKQENAAANTKAISKETGQIPSEEALKKGENKTHMLGNI